MAVVKVDINSGEYILDLLVDTEEKIEQIDGKSFKIGDICIGIGDISDGIISIEDQ